MTSSDLLAIAGLVLQLAGALVLAVRDLKRRQHRTATYDDVFHGFPRPETWLGFPLIAIGSTLQIIAIATS